MDASFYFLNWSVDLLSNKKKLISWIRLQMDGLTKTDELVFVLAATNLPWELDAAMLRRLEKRVSFFYLSMQLEILLVTSQRVKWLFCINILENYKDKLHILASMTCLRFQRLTYVNCQLLNFVLHSKFSKMEAWEPLNLGKSFVNLLFHS